MQKLFISVILVIFSAGVAFAAPDNGTTPQLDAFLKLNTLSAEFTQENYYPGLDNFTHKGKVYILRPEKALWDYENPVEYYLLEPGKVTHYSESLKQLIRMKIDSRNTSDATGLLLGIFLDSSKVKEQFSITEKDNTVTLVPKSELGLESIIITMDKSIINSVYSKDNEGNTVTIKFLKVEQDQPIDPAAFQKKLPEGTQIFEQ